MEFGFEYKVAESRFMEKRMFDILIGIQILRDLLCRLGVIKILKPKISNTIGVYW